MCRRVRFYATYCAIGPEGKQVISFCGGHGERYDHGHLSRVTVNPPIYGMNFGAAFAW